MPALTLGVLVLVFGAQVLCSPETQPGSSLDQTINPTDKMDESDQMETNHIQKRAPSYDFGLGKKRAYTYVSEYKRLPVYNFGLGKRSPAYEFGLGKRLHPFEEDDVDLEEEDAPWNNNQMMEQDDEGAEWSPDNDDELYDVDPKRARPYSFGLGKRLSSNSGEGSKRLAKGYEFGLGKRSPYEFGLGKRSPYDFGLGKRSPYEFGLGKRSPYEFGLGKRSPYEFGLGKRTPYEFGLGKKAYEFGLGKRAAYEFGLGKRAAYEFGLGKKAAYEFGLGKKSESPGKHLPGGNYQQLYEFGSGRRRRDLMSQDQEAETTSSQA